MLEIFRLQLRQVVGGRKRWLVLLFALLPILITWVNMSSVGGLAELKEREARELEGRVRATSLRRLLRPGEPLEVPKMLLSVEGGRVLFQGNPVETGVRIEIDGGRIVVEDGRIWIDETIPASGQFQISVSRDRRPSGFETISAIYLFLLYPQTICLLLALLYGSSLLGKELEQKTLIYLFTRPLRRWKIVIGKYLAIVASLIPPVAVSLFVSWKLLGSTGGPRLLWAMLAGAGGAILAYNAVFVLVGFLAPRRAMVAALLYAVVFEFVLSFVPALVNTWTITYYLRSLVLGIAELPVPRELSRVVGGASLGTSLLVLAGMIALGLGGASLLARHKEYVVADQP